LDSFGYERCLYGGDWPVFKLKTNVETQFEIVNTNVNKYFNNDQDIWKHIFFINAFKIYNLC
jgi:predicted TIM-barrel fold metal-dependent hydrolase